MADGQDKENTKDYSGQSAEEIPADLGSGTVKINIVPATPRMGDPSNKYVGLEQAAFDGDSKDSFFVVESPPSTSGRPVKESTPQPVLATPQLDCTSSEQAPAPIREKLLMPGESRDPNRLHEAVQVNFNDIIGEPNGLHSFDAIWETSQTVYKATNFWFYRILSLIFGIPCSILWGLYFACMAFSGVWCLMPVLRAVALPMTFVKKLWSITARTCLDPLFESMALWCSNVRIWVTRRE